MRQTLLWEAQHRQQKDDVDQQVGSAGHSTHSTHSMCSTPNDASQQPMLPSCPCPAGGRPHQAVPERRGALALLPALLPSFSLSLPRLLDGLPGRHCLWLLLLLA
jgi:hypothetical protein